MGGGVGVGGVGGEAEEVEGGGWDVYDFGEDVGGCGGGEEEVGAAEAVRNGCVIKYSCGRLPGWC